MNKCSYKVKFILLLICSSPYSITAQQAKPGIMASPYPIAIRQSDSSVLRIIGKVQQRIAYTETEDGYTILKNDRNVYEYAERGTRGSLVLSGIKAKDEAKRLEEDKEILRGTTKHLRYESPYLETLLEKRGNKPHH